MKKHRTRPSLRARRYDCDNLLNWIDRKIDYWDQKDANRVVWWQRRHPHVTIVAWQECIQRYAPAQQMIESYDEKENWIAANIPRGSYTHVTGTAIAFDDPKHAIWFKMRFSI